ncbi:MAG: hypothetical protein M3N08_04290 [Pseudomonadota bacterium]|nr:hypothetical protein [Pseudomonadota bacterium]
MRPSRTTNPWLILALAGGLIYAPAVYYGMSVLPASVLAMTGLALIGIRVLAVRGDPSMQIWRAAFLIASGAMVGMLFIDPTLAAKAYPVLVSLSVAAVFGLSLLYPPSMVERIARRTEPDLPRQGVIYTRRVTGVWTVFLVINAAISAATAFWGTLAQWTLWNGLLSYLLMGSLFVGEMILRRLVRK